MPGMHLQTQMTKTSSFLGAPAAAVDGASARHQPRSPRAAVASEHMLAGIRAEDEGAKGMVGEGG
jgi:hypothetical protein